MTKYIQTQCSCSRLGAAQGVEAGEHNSHGNVRYGNGMHKINKFGKCRNADASR